MTITNNDGLILLEHSHVFRDDRGLFTEIYNKKKLKDIGLEVDFVQDNYSKSKRGVLRGLHFQCPNPQGKLIKVMRGSILDVVVNMKKSSPFFGKHYKFLLSKENNRMLYIPEYFAHGFLSLQDDTEVLYKCTDFYQPQNERGIIWNDSDLSIDWNLENNKLNNEDLIISEKDKVLSLFKDSIYF
ncbi:dTDP-4-dehydrorhamnose 3,5-epimerase [Ichthyobacterium seriolicida]|uniref:dTDP-4-dehydrorhamnose 3,5-epimerase n=1 Tax=Ichthyobacterium seriolicida TaxID=242600 RepID=A0A1J1E6M1_9FLAO|nr:dTDP-4-dehydrorhamnose 3,5-epimerase [Ichthyobacterium seriolicida]BAV94982.1 dTDP-4-dehydrorhamnose 3,5-epimerase [Ichthyobacterium seriolicida]